MEAEGIAARTLFLWHAFNLSTLRMARISGRALLSGGLLKKWPPQDPPDYPPEYPPDWSPLLAGTVSTLAEWQDLQVLRALERQTIGAN